ncbi:hypothetical protein [Kineosporia sp. R_H_3]|uniref:hypothetical protein n=1 Tax=Kineosporia sp. R_H_3 TaxID=1961848 RepID=UPI000B4A579B|nr:hypothetical protein [Kineosporia sp. R_H_3]
MAARDPLFVVGPAGAGQTSPTEARLALSGLVAPASGGVDVRTGVFWGPGMTTLVSGTAAMTYSVAAFQAVANRGTAALGPYLGANDATATVITGAAPGTVGTKRIDVIWIRFPDAEQGDADSTAVLGVTQGTAAASPTVPSIPTGALALARAEVPQGTTRTDSGVTFTQVAPYTSAAGAPIAIRSSTERAALTQFDGLLIYRIDTGRYEVSVGGNWLTAIDPNAWQSYTPALTASTTNPTLGTGGSITGKYIQVGKTVHFRIAVTFGTSPNAGSGSYRFSLPVASVAITSGAGEAPARAMLWDSSASSRVPRAAYTFSSTIVSLLDESGALVGSAAPWTWAAGDIITIHGTYEAA